MRGAASKRMGTNGLGAEVKLAADQPMPPQRCHRAGPSEHSHGPRGRSTAGEDDPTVERRLQVGPPGGGEGLAIGRGPDAGRGTASIGPEIPAGAGVQILQRVMMESRPDFGLPPTVATFRGDRHRV